MIKITINNVYSEIEGTLPSSLKTLLEPFVPGYKFTYLFKRGRWDGRANLLENNKIGTGLVPAIVQLLAKERREVELIDNRIINSNYKSKKSLIDLRDYQVKAVNSVLTGNFVGSWWPRGSLKLSTGSGKTVIACALMDTVIEKTLFLTHRIDLIDQTQAKLNEFGLDCGVITAKRKQFNKRITVASIQSLLGFSKTFDKDKFVGKYIEDKENIEQWELELASDKWDAKVQKNKNDEQTIQKFLQGISVVIIDEAHLITSSVKGAGLFTKALGMMPNAYVRLGLTATPGLKDEFSNLTAKAGTGEVLYDLGSKELTAEGFLAPVRVSMFIMPQVSMPAAWPDCYELGVVSHRDRNAKIISMAASESGPTLILVSRVEHGKLLVELGKAQGMNLPFVFGTADAAERDKIKSGLNNGTIKAAVASTIWDEGIDIPNLKTVILAGGGRSAIKNLQRVGRGMRPGADKTKTELHLIDFWDKSSRVILNHSKIRERLWLEQGFKVQVIK